MTDDAFKEAAVEVVRFSKAKLSSVLVRARAQCVRGAACVSACSAGALCGRHMPQQRGAVCMRRPCCQSHALRCWRPLRRRCGRVCHGARRHCVSAARCAPVR